MLHSLHQCITLPSHFVTFLFLPAKYCANRHFPCLFLSSSYNLLQCCHILYCCCFFIVIHYFNFQGLKIISLTCFVLFYFSEALKLYRNKLSVHEQTEILNFPEIYFLGLESKKIETVQGSAPNNGYDDESGSYIKVY